MRSAFLLLGLYSMGGWMMFLTRLRLRINLVGKHKYYLLHITETLH